jgi:hypothetical protein
MENILNSEFRFLNERLAKSIKWVEDNKNQIDPKTSFIQAVQLRDMGIDVTQFKLKENE